VVKRRTVAFAGKRNSRDTCLLPMATSPALLVRHERTDRSSRLTLYSNLMLGGAPIFIVNHLKVDHFVCLSQPR